MHSALAPQASWARRMRSKHRAKGTTAMRGGDQKARPEVFSRLPLPTRWIELITDFVRKVPSLPRATVIARVEDAVLLLIHPTLGAVVILDSVPYVGRFPDIEDLVVPAFLLRSYDISSRLRI